MRRAEGQVQGGGLPSLMLRNDTSSPTSFPFSCGGTWDEREVSMEGQMGVSRRRGGCEMIQHLILSRGQTLLAYILHLA